MKLLGIDIGTTAVCGLLLDTDDFSVPQIVTLPNRAFIKTEKEYERIQDPEMIFATVCDIISRISVRPDAIGLSGQMHGIVYLDEHCRCVSDLYTWQDERGNMPYRDGKTYAEYLGTNSGYGLSTFLYNRVNKLEPEGSRYICTIGDYVGARLCSLDRPVMHITNAASIGCFDVNTNKFLVEYDLLPDVTDKFEFIGSTASGIPVSVCVGDNQASFIGSVPAKNSVLINIGTGAQISYLSKTAECNPLSEVRPFDSNRFLIAGCALCGGRAIALFEKFCKEVSALAGADIASYYPVFDRMDFEGFETSVRADCRFAGTRKDNSVRGGFSGLSENNFRVRDMLYSIYEGVIDELYSMYSPNVKPDAVYCSGNGIRKNPVILKIIEKYFGVVPKVTRISEEAAFGAALVSSTACGIFKNIDDAGAHIEVI